MFDLMERKIRIAYLIDTISSDKAGTEKQLLNIIARLDRNLFEVTLVCLYESPWMIRCSLPCEVICLRYKGFLNFGFPIVLRQYISLLKERHFDIVQTFFEDSMFVGYLGRLFCRTHHALIISRRDIGLGNDEPVYHWLYKKIKPFVLRSVDGIATNAHAIKEQIVRNENVPAEKVTVIGNGLDIPTFPKELPRLFSDYRDEIWVGIAANLKPVKRIDLLLRALAHLKESGITDVVSTVIMGDGRLSADLAKLALEVGISNRVHFVGAVNNVSNYLHCVDIGVLCSDKEGLSNAILEYMSCGLPVVATQAGGNCELVDETNGVCVPVGDYIALAQALAKLIQSSYLRKEMGNRSMEKVKQNFTWDKIIPQWECYYGSFAKGQVIGVNPMENAHAKA